MKVSYIILHGNSVEKAIQLLKIIKKYGFFYVGNLCKKISSLIELQHDEKSLATEEEFAIIVYLNTKDYRMINHTNMSWNSRKDIFLKRNCGTKELEYILEQYGSKKMIQLSL